MRGVEKLEAVKDEQVEQADLEYLKKTNMREFLQNAMITLLKTKPDDPLSFLINYIKNGPEAAVVLDPTLQIPTWRKTKLQTVYKRVDKV
jgi:hypothetical protein